MKALRICGNNLLMMMALQTIWNFSIGHSNRTQHMERAHFISIINNAIIPSSWSLREEERITNFDINHALKSLNSASVLDNVLLSVVCSNKEKYIPSFRKGLLWNFTRMIRPIGITDSITSSLRRPTAGQPPVERSKTVLRNCYLKSSDCFNLAKLVL